MFGMKEMNRAFLPGIGKGGIRRKKGRLKMILLVNSSGIVLNLQL